jgi:hypothetical protein
MRGSSPRRTKKSTARLTEAAAIPIDFERMGNSMHFEERASVKMPLLSTVSAHTEDERRMT